MTQCLQDPGGIFAGTDLWLISGFCLLPPVVGAVTATHYLLLEKLTSHIKASKVHTQALLALSFLATGTFQRETENRLGFISQA